LSTSLAESSLRGALRPRVEVHPPFAYTLAPVAIDLAGYAGLFLEQWQQDGLELLCARRDDDLWACPEYAEIVGRQNGKGAIAEARALAGLLLFGEELILWTAHEVKTAMRAFRRLKRLIRALGEQVGDDENRWLIEDERISPDPILIKFCNQNGDEGFERLERGEAVQELKYVARSKGSGRGFSSDLLFIDETYAYTDEQNEAVFSTMSARSNPQIVYTSTPPLSGTTGKVLFALRDRALEGDPDLAYRDWGLEGELEQLDELLKQWGTDLRDPRLAARSNPAYGGPRLSPAFVAREARGGLSRIGYARERLCLWPKNLHAGGSTVLPLDWWNARLDSTSAAKGLLGVGLDASPDLASAAVAMAGLREDGRRHWQVLEHQQGSAWVVPYLVTLRDGDPDRQLTPVEFGPIGVDPNSPAGALIVPLRAAGFEVKEITGRELVQAWGSFRTAVKDDQGRHLGQETIQQAIRDAKTAPSGDTERFSRKRSSGDICPLVAVALADHQLQTQPSRSAPLFAWSE
jgi:hypothetical protein